MPLESMPLESTETPDIAQPEKHITKERKEKTRGIKIRRVARYIIQSFTLTEKHLNQPTLSSAARTYSRSSDLNDGGSGVSWV